MASRQPSFLNFEEPENEEDQRRPQGVRSRLPASPRDRTTLVDMTPSGEVQMRVTREFLRKETETSGQASDDTTSSQDNLNRNSDMENRDDRDKRSYMDSLRKELAEHQEAERRIRSLLENQQQDEVHQSVLTCGGGDGNFSTRVNPVLSFEGRREQEDLRGPRVDQCYRPGTNFSQQVPHNMRDEGYGSIQVNRNRCVDTTDFLSQGNINSGSGINASTASFAVTNSALVHQNTNEASSSNSLGGNRLKPKRPPVYDGTTSWQDFLVQFQMISVVNNWDNAMKAYELATSLRGVAQGVVTDIEPAKRLDYDSLVKALTSRFEPENQANMYKSQLNSIYRKTGQTLPELGQEVRRVTRLAYPTAPIEIRDQLAKDCFIRAINDQKIQLSIFQRDPKTIDDCIRFGLDYEAFVMEQKRFAPKQGLRMQCELSDSELGSRLAMMSQQLNDLSTNKTKKKDMECYYCGVKGHLKKECYKLTRDIKNNCVKNDARPNKYRSSTSSGRQNSQSTQTSQQGNF